MSDAQSRWDKNAKEFVDFAMSEPESYAEMHRRIVALMSYAYRVGFDKADANPRQPESMGR